MTTPAKSSQLLDTINTKEADLVRLRREASTAVQEEIRVRDERLTELRSDFDHNLKVLRERDKVLSNLERAAAEANERRDREIATATRRAEERVAAIEEDSRLRERRLRDDYERRLSSEVDRRLAEREHSLREELAASAAAELAERERQISTAYDRAAADRESTCKRREGAAEKRIQDAERSAAADLKEAEDRWNSMESELRDRMSRAERAKNESEARLRETVAETQGVNSQRNEQLERLVREVKRLEQESKGLKEDNTRLEGLVVEKDSKISDLLKALVDLEDGFLRQHGALQEERDALANEVETKYSELEALHCGASQASSTYEKALVRLEKKMDKKKRQWAEKEMVLIDKADNLRNELNKLKTSKAEDDETSRRAVDAAKGTIGELEGCIAQLKEEESRRKHELDTAAQDLDDARRRNKSIHQEHKEILVRFEESKQAALQEMQSKHRIEFEKVQQEAIDDVRRALIDKNALSEEKKSLEKDVATLRSKVSSVKDKLEECRNRTSTNDEDVERLKNENARLQDALAILRSERETRNGVSREDELSQRVEELSDELEVVLEDRRRLIDLSNKLRVDLQRLQSSSRQSSSVDGNARRQDESVHDGVLSTQPLSLYNIIDAEAASASSTAKRQGTDSQRQAFARLRKKKDQQQQQERIKVRNWNERDDTR
mmetsp:Transcript_33788/g.68150  ORF Transcript_33788/g.68150 Transcript_33788/m.68150 type:complete len:670 (+) Transcript_33788:206-2215(+)